MKSFFSVLIFLLVSNLAICQRRPCWPSCKGKGSKTTTKDLTTTTTTATKTTGSNGEQNFDGQTSFVVTIKWFGFYNSVIQRWLPSFLMPIYTKISKSNKVVAELLWRYPHTTCPTCTTAILLTRSKCSLVYNASQLHMLALSQ